LAGEPLGDQVLSLLGLDPRDGEVVDEVAAGGGADADAGDEQEQQGDDGEPGPAGRRTSEGAQKGGHGRHRTRLRLLLYGV
jgi:hypothetical protein